MSEHTDRRTVADPTATTGALWPIYRRAAAREAAARREADAAWAVYQAAEARRAEQAAVTSSAHDAYLAAIGRAALVAAAEDIAFTVPHLFSE